MRAIRPFQNYPVWMLQAIIKYRKSGSMWLEAYDEIIERSKEAAAKHAEKHGAHLVESPRGFQ